MAALRTLFFGAGVEELSNAIVFLKGGKEAAGLPFSGRVGNGIQRGYRASGRGLRTRNGLPVFREPFLRYEELHQTLDIRAGPFEIAFGSVGGENVGFEEEVPGVGEGICFGEREFLALGVVFDEGDHGIEGLVLANEVQSSLRADFADGVDVVAAEEDTEVDELSSRERYSAFSLPCSSIDSHLSAIHL